MTLATLTVDHLHKLLTGPARPGPAHTWPTNRITAGLPDTGF